MIDQRATGVLCHITSLPSPYGIGDLGPEALSFADFLQRSKQKYWQVLPLNPTDHGMFDSPYSSFSAFGFNTLLISPDGLFKDGLLSREELAHCRIDSDGAVAFDKVYERKAWMLERAYARYMSRWFRSPAFDVFCEQKKSWLDDAALFVVLKRSYQGAGWFAWPVELRDRQPQALANARSRFCEEIRREKFAQFLFYRQWQALRSYCTKKGVGFIGDLPIYVNYDSVDVWCDPQFFKLDAGKRPTFVAGVPPDYFSKDGQRWGNPVYHWDGLKADGFSWWVRRLRHNLHFFDIVRIDHFRAFAQYWEIPASEPTAVKGVWRDVPGHELFTTFQRTFKPLPIIAEDLGIITPDVDALKDRFKLPGMCVFMFAFHNEYIKSRDLPDNYKTLSVAYTGTHDNNTIGGWFRDDITPVEKKNMFTYFGRELKADEVNWVMIEGVLRSKSVLAVIPVQDVLGLGAEARMNKPSTLKANWSWRLLPGVLSDAVADRLAALVVGSGR